VFVNDAQKLKCETLSARKTNEQKFWHADSLRTLGLLGDVVALLRNLRWMHYVEQKCVLYHRLILEYFSSLVVDWVGLYQGQEGLISFRMFNIDHGMSLRGLNELFHFPTYDYSF